MAKTCVVQMKDIGQSGIRSSDGGQEWSFWWLGDCIVSGITREEIERYTDAYKAGWRQVSDGIIAKEKHEGTASGFIKRRDGAGYMFSSWDECFRVEGF